MAINFPSSPTSGDLYTYNNVLYKYNGTFWSAVLGGPTAIGDANYTILTTDAFVYTSAAFTSSHGWTLPTAAAYRAGLPLTIADLFGTVTGTNFIQILRASTDTINGLTYVVLTEAYQSITLESDGVSKWTIVSGYANSNNPTTGDLKPTHKTTADVGWIMWSDGTIGNVGSGSGIRANADTTSLFSLYYNSYSDADCPILTSAGGATTRAAAGGGSGNWLTAFSTNLNRMTLPKGAGRTFGIAGSGSGLTSRTLGATAGAETETPTIAKTAVHNHGMRQTIIRSEGSVDATLSAGSTYNSSAVITSNSEGSGTALNILNPTTYMNVMIKL